ncbi:MAG: dihydroorotate dehydrogenase electron transfer subunit [Chloroflexi bacterium]|nr:dihydroorotate dehydrogenase electron transfer subunit [Chloroflexota bacterium]
MKQILAPIVSNSEIIPDVHLIRIEAPQVAAEARPGQFITACCGDDVLLRRPLSIHRIEEGQLALLFAVVGQGTAWLANRKQGESLDILGPLGNGFKVQQNTHNILLVAGGIGIAPLVCLAEKAVDDGISVKLILGTATATQHYSEVDGVEIIRVTEDGSLGEKGMVTDLLPSIAGWADQLFACGPISMYRTMAAMGTEIEGKSVQILLEQVMGCGVGACRGCAIPTHQGMKMVCQNGPVFDLREIMWEQITAPKIGQF